MGETMIKTVDGKLQISIPAVVPATPPPTVLQVALSDCQAQLGNAKAQKVANDAARVQAAAADQALIDLWQSRLTQATTLGVK